MRCFKLISLFANINKPKFVIPFVQPNGITHGISFDHRLQNTQSGFLSHNNLKISNNIRFSSNKPTSNGLPLLTDFPMVYWPSFLKYAKNAILSKFIIQQYYDPDFDLDDFIMASREAVGVVTDIMSRGDLKALKDLGLVTPDVVTQLQQNLCRFSLKQVLELKINPEDMYMSFPYEVGIIMPKDDDNDTRFVEITMCYHVLSGFKSIASSPDYSLQMINFEENIYILNYRFQRNFSRGSTNTQWIINGLNHCKPLVGGPNEN